jgi:hypothetical protein
MEFFEKLADETLIHIMENCDQKDLLILSETCKRFDEVISTSPRLMKKISLVIRGNRTRHTELEPLNSLVHNRLFKKVEIIECNSLYDTEVLSIKLLKHLGQTVDDLSFKHCQIIEKSFCRFFTFLLPKLNVCKIAGGLVKPNKVEGKAKKPSFDDLPLKELEISSKDENGLLLNYFSACKKLEKLHLNTKWYQKDAITGFLKQQSGLKHLKISIDLKSTIENRFAWDEMPFRLVFLKFIDSLTLNSSQGFVDILKHQQNLKELSICFKTAPTFDVMNAVCQLPKLGKLCININEPVWKKKKHQPDIDALMGLQNYTVEEIKTNQSELIGTLFQIFRNLKQIKTKATYLNLSDVSHLNLCKVLCRSKSLNFIFSPEHVPSNAFELEGNILSFLARYAGRIEQVKIGSESWLSQSAIIFESSFCTMIYQALPKLKRFEIFSTRKTSDVFKPSMIRKTSQIEIISHRNKSHQQESNEAKKKKKLEFKFTEYS